ncbi:uncharacterized protein LOC123202258 [Mangifera indica]|uniref:uncharacterized protein LOC123202258 n=1 Tax=Mangifera indica TaxID=29780 RepID=UPI001CFBB178|nr:uncharacterized protein LOC123202258 [Mangifera indica]
MFSNSTEVSQNYSIQIKEDDKFFSRLLSKETSMANPSFRVYYGGVAVAVPFLWESQPGTPKCNKFGEKALPPLTPPPSYYTSSPNIEQKPIKKRRFRSLSLLHIFFPKMNHKKTTNNVSFSSSSCSSSSTFSMVVPITSPLRKHRHARSKFSSRGSSFDSRIIEDEEPAFGSPTSPLSFKLRGCYGIVR